MFKLNVSLGERSYPIYVSTDFSDLGKALSQAEIGKKTVLVTDENVNLYHSDECEKALTVSGFEVHKLVIEAGEKSKNLDTVRRIYDFMIDLKLERNSTIIALGGGVVGDITGFAAATFLRGINFIQIPTTLLAQADSSVGGKVGVDFRGAKNIIGAFYQPKLVYVNVNTLKTLPLREIKAGMAEVVKHGIIMDSEFFDYIDYNTNKIFNFDESVLQYITKMNCTIKGKVVEKDEKESGLRAILNFGHTIGHAIESLSNFTMLHGECVSIGMVGAFKLAEKLGMVSKEATQKVVNVLCNIGLPVNAAGMSANDIYEQMFYDKKIKNNKLVFVLPKRIGEVVLCEVSDRELIKSVLDELV